MRTFSTVVMLAFIGSGVLAGAQDAEARGTKSVSIFGDVGSLVGTYSSPLVGVDFKLSDKFTIGPQVLIASSSFDTSVTSTTLGYGLRATFWLSEKAIGKGVTLSIPALYAPIGDYSIITASALIGYNLQAGPVYVRPSVGLAYARIDYTGTSSLGSAIAGLDGFGISYEALIGVAF